MFKSKYSNVLTVILIVSIIAILIIAVVLVGNVYKRIKNKKDQEKAISSLTNNVGNMNNIDNANSQGLVEQNVVEPISSSSNENTGVRKVTYFPNTSFVVIGRIEIPSISLSYSILEEETVSSLEKSVAVRYPSHATLNTTGNVVIAGHNYINGQFFSNLKRVGVGDIVKITDTTGVTLTYKVYEVYQTTPEDTGYITRNVGDNIEVTLVTCTDKGDNRIIVKARV